LSENKLKALLGRAPLGPIIILAALFSAALSLLIYGIYAAITLRIIDLLICGAGIYFLVRYAMRHLSGTLAFIRRSRKTGEKSIKRLEEKGLLEPAAEEYCSADTYRFRPESSGFSPESFTLRQNALSANFIFAMKDNAVFEYSDIETISFNRKGNNSLLKKAGLSDSCTVLTLTCTGGRSYNFYTCKGAFAEAPAEDIICREIIETVTQMNTDCRVEAEIKG